MQFLETLAPFHPRVVHFPIALSIVGALFILYGTVRRQDRWTGYGQMTLLLGWLGVMVAIVTGLIDQASAPQNATVATVINQHITAGIALVIAIGLALYWPLRDKKLWTTSTRWWYLALLVVIVVLVLIEGWLGGKLVYHLGVGVR
ncbi:MAG: DUF2231 domain-containing protein [Nitrososphaerales archaeon]